MAGKTTKKAAANPVQEILERPSVKEAIRAARAALGDAPLPQIPGPGRQQLPDLVA